MSTSSRIQAAFGQLLPPTPGKNNSILRLSRVYYILAVCAALFVSLAFVLNWLSHNRLSTSIFSHLFELILNWLVAIMAIGATVYGFRIARQATADARKYEQSFRESGQRANELAALYDTAQQLAGQYDLSAVLQTIVGRAKTLLGTSGCAIFLRDASRGDFEIAAETGAGMPIGAHLRFDEGLVGRVAQTSAPLIVNDYRDWPYRSQALKQLSIGAAVCVPMIRAGELIGVLGVHEDINAARKFTEDEARLLALFAHNAAGAVYNARLLDALRESEERFRIAARCASDIVYDWDLARGHVDYFGAVYERSRATASNLPKTRQQYWDMIHPEDRSRVQAALKNHLEEGKPFSEEYRIRNENGTYISVLDHGMAIRNPGGRPDKLIGAVVDITERKQTEQMRSDFVSFVTHQLRTPLAGVKWILELAMEESDTLEEMRSFIRDARASTDRLIGLVNDLLDVSRIERGKLQITCRDIDLADLTRCVVDEISPLVLEKRTCADCPRGQDAATAVLGSTAAAAGDPKSRRQCRQVHAAWGKHQNPDEPQRSSNTLGD